MTRRLTGLAAALAVSAALLTSACSSATPKSARLTEQQVAPLFMQCLLQHKITIWDKAEGNIPLARTAAREGWYKNGRVIANDSFYADMDSIEGTYPIDPRFKPEQMVGDWIMAAATTGKWPAICGPLPKAG